MYKIEIDEFKEAIIGGLSDLIAQKYLVEGWKNICYQIVGLKEVYNNNMINFEGRGSYANDINVFEGIYNVLTYAYGKGDKVFNEVFSVIVNKDKLNVPTLLKEGTRSYDRVYSTQDNSYFFKRGSDKDLNESFYEMVRYLNVLDLDIKLVQAGDKQKFKLMDFHSGDVVESINSLNVIQDYLSKNCPLTGNDYSAMIKCYIMNEPEACIDRARSVMEGFFFSLKPNDTDKWYFGADIISGDPVRVKSIDQLWKQDSDWYKEENKNGGDNQVNQKHPRFRFVYVFYKLASTLGVHTGINSRDIDVKQERKAEMVDALMCMQVVRSIIYWGISSSNKK